MSERADYRDAADLRNAKLRKVFSSHSQSNWKLQSLSAHIKKDGLNDIKTILHFIF